VQTVSLQKVLVHVCKQSETRPLSLTELCGFLPVVRWQMTNAKSN